MWSGGQGGANPPPPQYLFYLRKIFFWLVRKRGANRIRVTVGEKGMDELRTGSNKPSSVTTLTTS